MKMLASVRWKTLSAVALPALLIVALCIYVLAYKAPDSRELKVLPGPALAAHEDLYPIRVDTNGSLKLDTDTFGRAVNYFTDKPSPRAIADLIYLGNSNNILLLLEPATKAKYILLTKQPDYATLADVDHEKDRILQSYADIVNAIGQTFAGTPMEIVLHDTRNPLRSIIAVQNPISGRRVGDTNTNFGIQLIKNYSQGEGHGQGSSGSFVSYPLALKDGRSVKSTTIPIFHATFGLVGFICINVDISKLDKRNEYFVDHFVQAFKTTTDNDSISEMIQNSKRKN